MKNLKLKEIEKHSGGSEILEIVWIEKFVGIVWIEKFVSLESEKMKERMKKWSLYVEEKIQNEEMRRVERKKTKKREKRVWERESRSVQAGMT